MGPTWSPPASWVTSSRFFWTRSPDSWFHIGTKRARFESSTTPNLCCHFIVCSFPKPLPRGFARRPNPTIPNVRFLERQGCSNPRRARVVDWAHTDGDKLALPTRRPHLIIYDFSDGYWLILTLRLAVYVMLLRGGQKRCRFSLGEPEPVKYPCKGTRLEAAYPVDVTDDLLATGVSSVHDPRDEGRTAIGCDC